MSNCEHFQQLLPGYVDGVAKMDERAMVEEHLSTCTWCSASMRYLRRVDTTIAYWPELPADMQSRMKAIDTAVRMRTRDARWLSLPGWRSNRLLSLAASLAFVVFLGVLGVVLSTTFQHMQRAGQPTVAPAPSPADNATPTSGSEPLAAGLLKESIQAMKDVRSYRVTLEISPDMTSVEDYLITGESHSITTGEGMGTSEFIRAGGNYYWRTLPNGAWTMGKSVAITDTLTQGRDLAQAGVVGIAEQLEQDNADAQVIGPEAIDGVGTYHIRLSFDLERLYSTTPGIMATPSVAQPLRSVPASIDVWIGREDHYLYRVIVDTGGTEVKLGGDTETAGTVASLETPLPATIMPFHMVASYSMFNEPIKIEAPIEGIATESTTP